MIVIDKNTLNMELAKYDSGPFSIRPTSQGIPLLRDRDVVLFILKKKKDMPILLEKKGKVNSSEVGAEFLITPEDTKNLEPGTYLHTIKWYRSDGNIDTLIPGGNPYAIFTLKEGLKDE